MSLHPQASALLEALEEAPTIGPGSDPAELRAVMRVPPPEHPEAVGGLEDRLIPGPADPIPVRIYTPSGEGPFPLLVFFHGGGFVLCDLDSHDATCRALCNEATAVVVSVAYRLAPEHPYPAGPEDCFAATCWAAGHAQALGADASRLGVVGDSAGGCLAAAVTLMARQAGSPAIAFQGLIYPVTNCAFDTPSYRDNAQGYYLTREAMQWFWDQYLNDPAQADEPYASPLRAADLGGLPAASLVTAGYDPLRDEGRAYGQALAAAGVPVQLHHFAGHFHGFAGMLGILDDARPALRLIAGDFHSALDGTA